MNHSLNLGIGADYAHSYNIRTIKSNNISDSSWRTTDNMYVPIKLTYEYLNNNFAYGVYLRERTNIVGQDISHKYFIDGGFQIRYNIK